MRGRSRLGTFVLAAGALALALSSSASCVDGTPYDGSYEGGFNSGPGGSLIYSVVPSAGSPSILRSADGNFGVYLKQGTFDAPATLSIATSAGTGGNASSYVVSITGGALKLPYIAFFTNQNSNPGNSTMNVDGKAAAVQGSANNAFFGETRATTGTFSVVNETGGTTGGGLVLPQCLQSCGLTAPGNKSGSAYCAVGTSGTSNNGATGLFDCVIGCGDPDALAKSCASSARSIACSNGPACTGKQNCCIDDTSAMSQRCSDACNPGGLTIECLGTSDCQSGMHCCAVAKGTKCGNCMQDEVVCNKAQESDCQSAGVAGPCGNSAGCTVGSFGQLMLCGSPKTCPVQPGRSVVCGSPGPTCTGTQICCADKQSSSGSCITGMCMSNQYSIECEGAADCAGSPGGSTCCAVANGTQCGSCSADHTVCLKSPQTDCASGAGSCMHPVACTGTGFLNVLELCGTPPTCPVGAHSIACGPSKTCTGEVCCWPGSGNTGTCISQGSPCGAGGQHVMECLGPADCAGSPNGNFCLADPGGTRCSTTSGSMSNACLSQIDCMTGTCMLAPCAGINGFQTLKLCGANTCPVQ